MLKNVCGIKLSFVLNCVRHLLLLSSYQFSFQMLASALGVLPSRMLILAITVCAPESFSGVFHMLGISQSVLTLFEMIMCSTQTSTSNTNSF